MALQMSRYEPAAEAFLDSFPIGTIVGGEEILGFAEQHSDGLASDLLIGDPGKRLSTLRRHLNSGAASRAFSEDKRFIIDVEDAKNKVYIVRKLAAYVTENAKDGVDKSVLGAIAPLNSRMRGLDNIKKEELTDDERSALETEMRELLDFQQQVKPVLTAEITAHYTRQLTAQGMSETEARRMLQESTLLLAFKQVMKKLS